MNFVKQTLFVLKITVSFREDWSDLPFGAAFNLVISIGLP